MNQLDSLFTAQQQAPAQPAQEYRTRTDRTSERGNVTRSEDGVASRDKKDRDSSDIQANFLDFILAQNAAGDLAQDNSSSITPTIDVFREPLKVESTPVISATPEVTNEVIQLVEHTELGPNVELSNALALNKAALKDILDQAGINSDALTIEGAEIPEELSALLNLNLTPAQLAALQEASENGESNDTLEQLISSIVTIIAPDDKDQQHALNAALTAQLAAEDTHLTNEAAALNQAQLTDTPKTAEHTDTSIAKQQSEVSRSSSLNVGWSESGVQEEQALKYLNSNFKAALKDAQEQGAPGTAKDTPSPTSIAGASAANAQNANSAAGSTLQGWPFTLEGGLLAQQDGAQLFAPELGQVAGGSPNATQMSGLTSLIGQSQSASHAHPASQMVAANMQKSVGKGGSTQITIQLDPPELGRVEVRMHFDKDKSVKATLMIEKPETHTMMQRDAQLLERAMQDMGLDTDGGINFELAEQGFDFDQDNQRGGGHDDGGTGAGGKDSSEDLELIETTMTWQVDAESGHMRYNIWA